MSSENGLLDTFTTFGDLLKYLRVRAQLTQRDLSIAVGYSEAQISRQESNKRIPSDYALKALFVPALGLEDAPSVVARLLTLADKARNQDHPWVVTGPEEIVSQPPAGQPVRHNLPRSLSSFIGREKEIEQVIGMVREHPLVTLTGAGGVGKTRLALQAVKELEDTFPDGIYWVELAPISDPISILNVVASIFNIQNAIGSMLLLELRAYLASKQLLLILDNCEHVIDAVAELSVTLLEGCPNISILATSREILGVEGEIIFRCPSLSLPDALLAQPSKTILMRAQASEAVRLFVERASAVLPGFCITEENALNIINICQRLDGIPLAIELAAARARLLSLEQIAGHMDDVFRLLTGNIRSAIPRHKTLKALIDWSYQLLSPAEQTLLRWLSIFAGGWTLSAAEAVAGGAGVSPSEVFDRMGQLVDKSLIVVKPSEVGENHYYMLETIRQFANERLQESGEYLMARDQHLAYFSALVEQANPSDSHDYYKPVPVQQLVKEFDNIRLALEWSLETNIELGLRLGLSFNGIVHFNLSLEIRMWLERLLAADLAERAKGDYPVDDLQRNLLRGKALLVVGEDNMLWGFKNRSEQALLESKTLFETIGEPAEFWGAIGLMHLGTLIICANPEQSRVYLETGRETFKKMGEEFSLSNCDRILVALNLFTGNLKKARAFADESLLLCKALNIEVASDVEKAGDVEFLMGNYDRAIDYYHQAREITNKFEDFSLISWEMYREGCVEWARGNNERVLSLSDELMALGRVKDSTSCFLHANTLRALLGWAQGKYDQVVRQGEEGLSRYRAECVDYIGHFVYALGRVALSGCEFEKAEQYICQVDDMSEGPRWIWKAYSLHAFGLLAAAQSDGRPDMAVRAATLFGAQEKLFAWLSTLLSPFERDEYAGLLAQVKGDLGEASFSSAWAQGQAMSDAQAFALARADTPTDRLRA